MQGWLGRCAEPKESNPRSAGKAWYHLNSGKQEENVWLSGRIRDQRMGPVGIWAKSNLAEPTGVGLPRTIWRDTIFGGSSGAGSRMASRPLRLLAPRTPRHLV